MQSRAIWPAKRCVPAAGAGATTRPALRPAPTSPNEPSSFRPFAIVAVPACLFKRLFGRSTRPARLESPRNSTFPAFDLHALKKDAPNASKQRISTFGALDP
ncbi:hypothetical protein IWX49DRAFT_552886 [Phyllosticta citricarpa]